MALLLAGSAISSTLAIWLNAEQQPSTTGAAHGPSPRHAQPPGRAAVCRSDALGGGPIRITNELRSAAIAGLAPVDLRWCGGSVMPPRITFSRGCGPGRYALGDSEGNVSVYRVADGREIVRLPRGGGPSRHLEFSPDGRYLIAGYEDPAVRGDLYFDLWDIGRGGPPRKVMERADHFLHFSADGRRIASRLSETTIGLYDPATGQLSKRLTVARLFDVEKFHPDGQRLMVHAPSPGRSADRRRVRAGEVWSHVRGRHEERWSGVGRLFAASGSDHRIYGWDMAANRLQSVLEGHQNTVVASSSPTGRSVDLLLLGRHGGSGIRSAAPTWSPQCRLHPERPR